MADVSLLNGARAAQILQSRWDRDPLRHFLPSDKQQMFLDCTKPEAALLGANRSGKSDALAALIASYARFGNPNPRFAYSSGGKLAIAERAVAIWVVGLTEKLFKEGIQPKIITTAYTAAETHPAFIPPSEIADWNINEQTWRLKNGSFITFKSADAGAGVFQSVARDLVAFDEICEWDVYKEACMRVGGGSRKLMIRLAATLLPPLGQAGGVSWYFPQKIKPWWAEGNKENTPNDSNPSKYLDIFSMGLRDNPGIARDEIERMESMFAPDDPERRIRIDGELLATVGGAVAYRAYNPHIHRDPRITPENRDMRAPMVIAVDFNVTPCVWEIGQYIDNCWFFFDEIRMDNCDIPSMVRTFRERYPQHGAEIHVYGDASGKNRSPQSGKTNYFVMAEAFKGYPVPVKQFIPESNPPVRDRINAMNRQLMGLDGRIGLVLGPLCIELDADLSEVLRSTDGGILKSKNPTTPYFFRTHASDAVGYAVTYVNPVPIFTSGERKKFSIPMPGYNGKGGRNVVGSMGAPPASYNADGRIRFSAGMGIRPPKRP